MKFIFKYIRLASKATRSLLFTHSELQHKEYQYNQNEGVLIQRTLKNSGW